MIDILDVKSHATIQDLGRFGLRRFGISHCGAMDKLALSAGNILLGNAENVPAIEVHLGGITLQFQQDMNFCVTGAFYEMMLDNDNLIDYLPNSYGLYLKSEAGIITSQVKLLEIEY